MFNNDNFIPIVLKSKPDLRLVTLGGKVWERSLKVHPSPDNTARTAKVIYISDTAEAG